MPMCFGFQILNDPSYNQKTIWYYNCNENTIRGFHNEDEYGFIKQTYKETTGYDLKTYVWDANVAPVYLRIFGVLDPIPYGKSEATMIEDLKKAVADYILAFGDPNWFIARMVLPIRDSPSKAGSILGFSSVNQKFEVSDAVTACDIHWAEITYNGKKAYIPMGDITGDEYGIKENRKFRAPTVNEAMTWAEGMAKQGGSDPARPGTIFKSPSDGFEKNVVYNNQNLDFISWMFNNLFGQPLFGSGKDFLEAASIYGYNVLYGNQGETIQKGDVVQFKRSDGEYLLMYVVDVSGDNIKTLYQHFNKPDSGLPLGGKIEYINISMNSQNGSVIGWVRPNYSTTATADLPANPQPDKPINAGTNSANYKKLKDENGTYIVKVQAVNVRRLPTLSGEIVDMYRYDGVIKYDSVYVGDGYIWVSYIGGSGKRNYVACGEAKNDRNINPFGYFF